MIHRLHVVAVSLLVAAATLGSTSAADAHRSPARATKNCEPPTYPGSGYFTSLRVSRTPCAAGKAVTLAHYRCRVRKGRTGKCASRVQGYRCSEKRSTISTEIDSIVTCRKGDARVIYSYQQNT